MASLNMLVQPYRVTVRQGGVSGTIRSREWTIWSNEWAGVQAMNKSATWVNAWLPKQSWTWLASGSAPTSPSASNSVLHQTYNTYDGYGRVTKQTDARGSTTEFYFGTNAAQFSNAEVATGFRNSFLTGVRMTAGSKVLEVAYQYNASGVNWGLASQIRDEGGTIRKFAYDAHRRLNKIDNLANQPLWQYNYVFTAGDPIASPSYVRTTRSLDGSTSVVSTKYVDGLGRPRISEIQDGPRYIVSLTEYNAQGKPWKQWLPYASDSSATYSTMAAASYYQGSTTPDPANFDRCGGAVATPFVEMVYTSDPLNRLAARNSPYCASATAVATYSYGVEGNRLFEHEVGEAARAVRTLTDGWGRRRRSTAGYGAVGAATTNFAYNVLDKVTQVTDPRGLQTIYVYDGLSRLTSKTSPDAGQVQFKYNNAGEVRYRRDARQNVANRVGFMQYDGFGRPTRAGEAAASASAYAALDGNTVASFEGTTSNWLTVHFYDAKPPTTSFPWNIAAFSSAVTSATMSNLNSRLAATAQKSDGVWQLTLYSYDADGYLVMKRIVTDGLASHTTRCAGAGRCCRRALLVRGERTDRACRFRDSSRRNRVDAGELLSPLQRRDS